MKLIRFLKNEAPATWYRIVLLAMMSGLAGVSVLAVINYAVSVQGSGGPVNGQAHRLMLLFVIALTLYVVTKQTAIVRSVTVVEKMIANLRIRICDKIRRAELEVIEGLDKSETFTTISQETNTISESALVLTNSSQQALLLVIGTLYLAWVSKAAFALFVVVAGCCAAFYLSHLRRIGEERKKDTIKQAQLFSHLSHILFGTKELCLNRKKGDQLFSEMTGTAREAQHLRVETSKFFVNGIIYADVSLYLLLGTIVFILPQLVPTYREVLTDAIVAVLFVFGPLGSVVGTLPQLSLAEAALDNLYGLEEYLDKCDAAGQLEGALPVGSLAGFQTISCQEIVYAYKDAADVSTFKVGPVELDIRRGEIVFIVGGNGSGKSTLLKLISGLYHAQHGQLTVDGRPIRGRNLAAYRELIGGVFAEFHLFDRLYGIDNIDERVAREMLEMMEIADKVAIKDGRFSTLDLSTGQRKRLALIAALLEDRDIYVFDEWTADQDPHFRGQFYGLILPDLKQKGKTIISVTHDDRYWGTADRVIKLDYGKIVEDISQPGNGLDR